MALTSVRQCLAGSLALALALPLVLSHQSLAGAVGAGAGAGVNTTVLVRPWGDHAIRVQMCAGVCSDALPGALGVTPPPSGSGAAQTTQTTLANGDAVTTSGNLACTVKQATGLIACSRVDDSKVLLTQTRATNPGSAEGGSATFDFSSSAEVVYGMGQANCPCCLFAPKQSSLPACALHAVPQLHPNPCFRRRRRLGFRRAPAHAVPLRLAPPRPASPRPTAPATDAHCWPPRRALLCWFAAAVVLGSITEPAPELGPGHGLRLPHAQPRRAEPDV